jgi:hypothetical protein
MSETIQSIAKDDPFHGVCAAGPAHDAPHDAV